MLVGTSPSVLYAPLPNLGVSGGSGHVLPLGGPLAPSPGNSVPGTLPHLFLPDPVGHPPTLVSQSSGSVGQDGGGQALLVGLDCI